MKVLYDFTGNELKLGDNVRVKIKPEQSLSFNCTVDCDATGWLLVDCETRDKFRPEGYTIFYGHHTPDVSVHEMLMDGLSTRCYHSLLQAKIINLQGIVDKGVDKIFKLPRMGSDSMNNLQQVCLKYGVNLLNE